MNSYINRSSLSSFAATIGLRYILSILILLFMAGCTGSGSSDDLNAASAADISNTQSSLDSKPVSLLESLQALYPSGKMGEQLAHESKSALAQNPTVLQMTSTAASVSLAPTFKSQAVVTSNFMPVKRVQNTELTGAYFFTIWPDELSSALASHPNWRLEGTAFYASIAAGAGLSPVWRFRNVKNGSYVFTIYDSERLSIINNYSSTFAYEGVAWHASQTPLAGYSALYRFRNVTNGTYLFSAYQSERDSIIANYPTIFAYEGIAYYVAQGTEYDGATLVNGFSTYAVVGQQQRKTFDVVPKNINNNVLSLSIKNPTAGGGVPTITTAGLVTWTPTQTDFTSTTALQVTAKMRLGEDVVMTAPVDVRNYRQILRTTLLANESTYSDAEGRYLVKVKKINTALTLQGELFIVEEYNKTGVFSSRYFLTGNGNARLDLLEVPNPVIPVVATAAGQPSMVQGLQPQLAPALSGLNEIPEAVPGTGSIIGVAGALGDGTNIATSREVFWYKTVVDYNPITNAFQPREVYSDNSRAMLNYYGSCNSICTRTKTPVILIHGFNPELNANSEGYGSGGSGTWGTLSQAILDNGSDVFEMRWYTQMRFEEAAAKLADFSRYVALKTGKKPLIIAHSFGGIVTHLALQKKGIQWNGTAWVQQSVDMQNIVKQVLTINSPLSGIQSNAASNVNSMLTLGRDDSDLMISTCGSITCAQAGANKYFGTSFPDISFIDSSKTSINHGESILKLRINNGYNFANTTVPSLALVGTRYLPADDIVSLDQWNQWKLGDGLISLLGQALDARDFAANPFPNVVGKSYIFNSNLSIANINSLRTGGECLSHQATTNGIHKYLICARSAHNSLKQIIRVNDYASALYESPLAQSDSIANPVHPLKRVLFDGFTFLSASTPGLLSGTAAAYSEPGFMHSIIHGKVSNATTGATIPSAWVYARLLNKSTGQPVWFLPSLPLAKTNSLGVYSFDAGYFFSGAATALMSLTNYSVKLKIQVEGYDNWEDTVLDMDPDVIKNAQLTTPGALVNATATVQDGQNGSLLVAGANVYLAMGTNIAQDKLLQISPNATNVSRKLVSDANGQFTITGVRPGAYSVLISKPGYTNLLQGNVWISSNGVLTFSIIKTLLAGESSITLRWANSAAGANVSSDLDSHLIRLNGATLDYHIYYSATTAYGTTDNLDWDDTSFEGPETITFTNNTSYNYVYYVHDYRDYNTSIIGSFPSVTLRTGSSERIFQPPSQSGSVGRYWRVFDIVNGQVIRCVNSCLQDIEPVSLGAQNFVDSPAGQMITSGSAPLSSDVRSILSNLPKK